MVPTHKNKRDTRANEFRQLLSKTSIQIIGDYLFTKSTTQKEKEMRVEIKKRKEFPKNTKKHLRGKQNTLLQSRTPTHHRNRHIKSHHESNSNTRRRINNI